MAENKYKEFIPGEGWVYKELDSGYENEFFGTADTADTDVTGTQEETGFWDAPFKYLPFYSGPLDWNFSPEKATLIDNSVPGKKFEPGTGWVDVEEPSGYENEFTDYSNTNEFTAKQDDSFEDILQKDLQKIKLMANSLTGGAHDLGQLFWEGNPASYLAKWWTGEDVDLPGLPEWAFGGTPFEEGGGTFFDYDEDFKPWGFDPESVENVGRAVSSLAVPFAGWATAPVKGKKIYDAMSKVFPSLKHWDDVGIMNQKIRAAINAEKGVKSNWPKITALWDRIRPLYQAPYRAARHIINPLRWRKNYDAKLGEKILKLKETPVKAIKNMSKISKPEREYFGTAGRNWALATGTRGVVEAMDHPAKAQGIETVYQDPIMRMARDRNKGLEVTVPLPYQK